MAEPAFVVKNTAGTLLLKTLFPTERGAKVNWLCTDCSIVAGALTSDEEINRLWDKLAPLLGVEIVPVSVSEVVRTGEPMPSG